MWDRRIREEMLLETLEEMLEGLAGRKGDSAEEEKPMFLWTMSRQEGPGQEVTCSCILDVTGLIQAGRRKNLEPDMLMAYCIGKAASMAEGFCRPPGMDGLAQNRAVAVGISVENADGGTNFCDIFFEPDPDRFVSGYRWHRNQAVLNCRDRDLSANCVVIRTAAYPGVWDIGDKGLGLGCKEGPSVCWGKYLRRRWNRATQYLLKVYFKYSGELVNDTQSDAFLLALKHEADSLR